MVLLRYCSCGMVTVTLRGRWQCCSGSGDLKQQGSGEIVRERRERGGGRSGSRTTVRTWVLFVGQRGQVRFVRVTNITTSINTAVISSTR